MAISIRWSGGWLADSEREARLNCLECRRMDGTDGRGGACSVSTRVQLTPPPPPSSPALGYRASPKVSSCQAGQDLDLVAAHGEPRYDIVARGQAPLACCPLLLCRLQALGAWATSELFPAASDEIFFFLPLGVSCLHTHTHTRTHTRTSFLFLSRTFHSRTPHDHADLSSLHKPPPPMPLSILVRLLQPVEQFELSFSAA